ncbi:adhesion G-protein coupled receptor F3 isoform X2 [Gasterosteus aculeatus]
MCSLYPGTKHLSENSTQMYYIKLIVEDSAIPNVSAALRPFVKNTNVKVSDLKMTTCCWKVQGATQCSCEPSFRWSETLCQEPGQKCCGRESCSFTNRTAAMCVSNETVSIRGSITLNGLEYYKCLKGKDFEEFKQCDTSLMEKMKAVYSTMAGFDTLTISKYRVGSVIADFEMTFANQIKQQYLINGSKSLGSNLSASVYLETTGVVRLFMLPRNQVCYYDTPTLTCEVQEDLHTQPVWQLKRADKVFEIFTGTEAEVTRKTMETKVFLRNISELWAGEYTCIYPQVNNFIKINHTASAVLNVSLLPSIDITMTPPFPHCSGSELVTVKVTCQIASNNESYNVTWTEHKLVGLFPVTNDALTANVVASCKNSQVTPDVTCTFKNRCGEERKASAAVNIIYENEKFCPADGDWKDTKAGFEAVLKCTSGTGQRKRKCQTGGSWDIESSSCVTVKVNDVLQKAKIIDTGLGALDENAAEVFSLLHNVTNDSVTINSSPDIGASVSVLFSLGQKIKSIDNELTVADFLASSSNMLNSSLEKSWTSAGDIGNITLAEAYLLSLEKLIHKANLSHASETHNVDAVVSNCNQRSKCSATVFNDSVELVGQDPGDVKTAGFKELENYLPNHYETYEPNSNIVSVTTENRQFQPTVRINFSLIKPRPRDVQIICVAWDNNTRNWSPKGCEWVASSNGGLCICQHLSSFAILMSRSPIELKGLTQLTLVGLSVSVMSLIVTLAIELTVWSSVVKTDQSYIRHTAQLNICLCLLVADCCFLASLKPSYDNKEMWCQIFVLLKHFSFLSVFFWMFSLSSVLLLNNVFVLHAVSRKTYLRMSLVLGYVCPLLIAIITFLCYDQGAEGAYYSSKTCWLRYTGLLEGSIHTFVIPVGAIVFFNVFSMVVVIVKLLDRSATTYRHNETEKKAAVTVIRSVILLTPIFGVTWMFGFAVMLVDLTTGLMATATHYTFTLLNTFQGLFLLLTTCLADKQTRDVLLKRLRRDAAVTDSTTKLSQL